MSVQASTGMDSFNVVTLQLFDRLYDSFPRPLNINHTLASDIGFSAVPVDATEEQAWEIGTMTNDVVEWLAEEGFLRYEKDPNQIPGNYWCVRLSLKGLAILGSIPMGLTMKEEKVPLISNIKELLKEGSKKVASDAAKFVILEIFKYALAPTAIVAAQLI